MPAFRSGRVERVLQERAGLQRVLVVLDGNVERAYVLTQLTGTVAPGDSVVVNTTAVDLGLGTGGWHVVHWNLERDEWAAGGGGHVMKLRHTSLQADTGAAEEHGVAPAALDGMPVVACSLHSQIGPVAAALLDCQPAWRVAYVMPDAAALPLALSDLVAGLGAARFAHLTVTAGQAFGGEVE